MDEGQAPAPVNDDKQDEDVQPAADVSSQPADDNAPAEQSDGNDGDDSDDSADDEAAPAPEA